MILNKIKTAEGKIVVQTQSQVKGKLPAGSQTLELIKKGLWGVVNDGRGTAKATRIKGIDISGKTGTVQVVGRKDDEETSETEKPDHLKAHAWFVAYAPSVNPQIAVAVIIEHGESGSQAAAPIAREMIRTYLKKTGPGKQLKAEGSKLKAVKVVNDG